MTKNSDDSTSVSGTASAVEDGSTGRISVLTGKRFADLIRQGKTHGLNGCRVLGDVDLTKITIETPMVIRGAVFMGEVNFGRTVFAGKVDLSECRFERRVDLTGCHFEQRVILSDARVEGPLILDKAVIGEKTESVPDPVMIRPIIASLKEGR